jgi:hypothetical protein
MRLELKNLSGSELITYLMELVLRTKNRLALHLGAEHNLSTEHCNQKRQHLCWRFRLS